MKTADIIKLITEDDYILPQQQTNCSVKPGDIFYTSWGYDQTNYDFLIILSISPTKKTCQCQMVHRNHLRVSIPSNVQKPNHNRYGDIFRMKIDYSYLKDGIPTLRGSYPYCNDGSMKHTRLDTFWKWDGIREFHETMAEFGH